MLRIVYANDESCKEYHYIGLLLSMNVNGVGFGYKILSNILL